MIDAVLAIMRAAWIPEGSRGLWSIRRGRTTKTDRIGDHARPPGTYTSLLHSAPCRPDVVMSDDEIELRRHLEFVLHARGRVLVTGLGLGCVVRGLAAVGAVESIDVVERDADVIHLVGPYLWDPLTSEIPVRIHCADALDFVRRRRHRRWDFAWHDLWTDEAQGEEALPIVHQRLLLELRGRVGWQGAWAFPRDVRRVLRVRFPDTRFGRQGRCRSPS